MFCKLLHCSDHSFLICQVRCWHKLLPLHPKKFSFRRSRMSPKNLHFHPILSAAAATPSLRFMLRESLNFMANKSFSAIKFFFFFPLRLQETRGQGGQYWWPKETFATSKTTQIKLTALPVIVNNYRQTKCPFVKDWLTKLRYIPTK